MEEYKSPVDTGKIWSIVRDAMLKGSRLGNRFCAGNTEEYHSHIDAESAHYAEKIAELFAEQPAQEHPIPVRTSDRLPTEADVEFYIHVGNEWADMATSGLQWLLNIRDNVSTVESAIDNMQQLLKHCQETGLRKPTEPSNQ
jgi:hypothetical protein